MNAPTSAFQPTFFRWCAWLELGEAETAQRIVLVHLEPERVAARGGPSFDLVEQRSSDAR